ncbi:MAG: signal peptidase I [Candidatus Bathyarchaeota archaeon]
MNIPAFLKRDYMQTVIMIVVVIIAVLVFWFGLSYIFKTDHPVLAVASGSMEPVLYAGDLIVIEGIPDVNDIYAAPASANPPGDIVVYKGTSELIVHRVIDKTIANNGVITFIFHGDANPPGANEQVNEARIVGRYVGFKIPWLGHIALFFDPPERKIAFVGLWIIILLIVELIPTIRKQLKNDKNEPSL